jgi:hypothetical protein
MSITPLHLAIDFFDPATGRAMPNGIPKELHRQIEQMDGRRLDYPRLIYYLKQCGIDTKLVNTVDAPVGSLYPMVLGFFDFTLDYFSLLSPTAYEKIKNKTMKLVFTYHEGDNPGRIRQRLDELCQKHQFDPAIVWFISGNSTANNYGNTAYWPELEFMYWRTVDLGSGAPFHDNKRTKKFTALCRIDKLWRSVFMSELWRNNLHQQGYFSYNQFDLGSESNYFDCALNNDYLALKQSQVDQFIAAGPFKADDLDSNTHNNYAANMSSFYSDSYFNIVLETMIDVDGSNGVFLTEKTFKPIFNNQFFIEVSSANTLKHLRELGYKTFSTCIDEHYDTIENNQERFECVIELAKNLIALPQDQLHAVYQNLKPEICYNSTVFQTGMKHRLAAVIKKIL